MCTTVSIKTCIECYIEHSGPSSPVCVPLCRPRRCLWSSQPALHRTSPVEQYIIETAMQLYKSISNPLKPSSTSSTDSA